MSKPEIVEWYVVVTVPSTAGLPVEDTRSEAADLLRYAADQIERMGFQGGVFATEDDPPGEVEVMLAAANGGAAFPLPGEEGEA